MTDLLPYPKPRDKEGRVTLSAKERRALLDEFCAKQNMRCVTCNCRMTREPDQMNTASLGHKDPQPAGCRKRDNPDNIIGAQCIRCNFIRGSRRG